MKNESIILLLKCVISSIKASDRNTAICTLETLITELED